MKQVTSSSSCTPLLSAVAVVGAACASTTSTDATTASHGVTAPKPSTVFSSDFSLLLHTLQEQKQTFRTTATIQSNDNLFTTTTTAGWFRSIGKVDVQNYDQTDYSHNNRNDYSTTQQQQVLLSIRGGDIGEKSNHTDSKKKKTSKESSSSSSSSSVKSNNSTKRTKKSATPTPPTTPSKKHGIVEDIIKESDYYKILGLTKSSSSITEKDIQKAYRKRAVQTHPDKTNGDRRAFDKVAEAYDVLSDSKKRSLYDRFGKKGVDGTTASDGNPFGNAGASSSSNGFTSFGGSPEDIFRSFFFSDGSSSSSTNPFFSTDGRQRRQGNVNRTARYELEVSLEDMYNGVSRRVQLPKQTYNPFARRQPTHNKGSEPENKNVEVDIPKGSYDGQNIILSGANDSNENETPGDLIFTLKQRPHPTFTRKGYDLAFQLEITLSEALCGFTKTIRHINGKTISITSATRGVPQSHTKQSNLSSQSQNHQNQNQHQHQHQQPIPIQTGDVQVLKSYGMPKDNRGMSYGDLYVQFVVQLPSSSTASPSTVLTDSEQKELRRLLRKLEGKVTTTSDSSYLNSNNNNDVHQLHQASLSDFGRASGQPRTNNNNNNSFDHNDDDHLHGDDHQEGYTSSFQDGNTRRYYFSSNGNGTPPTDPFGFFGASAATGEDETQCRQM